MSQPSCLSGIKRNGILVLVSKVEPQVYPLRPDLDFPLSLTTPAPIPIIPNTLQNAFYASAAGQRQAPVPGAFRSDRIDGPHNPPESPADVDLPLQFDLAEAEVLPRELRLPSVRRGIDPPPPSDCRVAEAPGF